MRHVSNKKRLEELRSLGILDTGPEKRYDDITDLAALICHAPIAMISLVDQDRLFFKSHHGLNIRQTKVENSFCARTTEFSQEPVIVQDARKDEVFKEYSLVKGKPNYVFYAGVALVSNSGNALGALCILDREPRELDQDQIDGLTALARQVVHLFELRKFSLEAEDMKTNLLAESQR
ncbi:MAG TPA: GAF domain-containing protein, partial [Cryomorphaceae bacterium]|nr:GAF domain-containing protein [Cryomorphaceae bacterium]